MNKGDIILLLDGRMFRFLEKTDWTDTTYVVQFLDKGECTYCNIEKFVIDRNLGQESSVVAAFVTAHSIHVRLNNLRSV